MSFVHLHLHTHHSLLDGLGKPEDYLDRAVELKMPACAITDHGAAYGLIDFYKKAKERGIQPILGCEAYIARFGRLQKRANVDVKPWHMVLLAETLEGYQNLLKLVTKAHLDGYYYKPRMDWDLLEQHGQGLIASSACLKGEIPSKLLSGNFNEAEEAVQRFKKVFGEKNFFLELQDHPEIEDQTKANALVMELAKKTKTPLIATNDCHYVSPEDAEAHDVLLCVQTGSQMADENRMKMTGTDLSFRTAEDMRKVFPQVPEACDNTLEIAKRCQVELPLDKRLIPTYTTPFSRDPNEYLRELCYEGLQKRFGIPIPKELQRVDGSEGSLLRRGSGVQAEDSGQGIGGQEQKQKTKPSTLDPKTSQKIIERLEYELDVITKMGFANYFLIVWDFVKFAKESGIMVGPGRGSAAGSLISYCLDITNLDPLKYGLLFERFLNPERVSMPDIDIDFADNRRDEVLEYVAEKYGRDHVARIITFGTLAARAAVKDAGRVFGVSFADMNSFSKLIPSRPGTTLEEAYTAEQELRETVKKEPFKKVYKIARKLEGVIRQAGVHACAVVIADKPLTAYLPLQYAPGDDDNIITQYSMHPVDDIGLLKMDFLGLRNLTILQKALNIIRRIHKTEIDISEIPMDDKKTIELFQKPDTTGVFQFESSGMKRYLKDLRSTQFEDLIAMVALFRPGPMENIPQYIRGKHDPKSVKYPHPVLEHFLKETYGVAVYQEQVQMIAQEFAGFTLGEGYLLIKAVAKKIPKLLEEQREKFIRGALEKGHKQVEAKRLFEVIEPFAGYGFNKSHAASYALISYQTAYLKAHYPSEFMAALLTADHGNIDRLTIDIDECERMGICVLPPNVNESLANFTVVAGGDVRFGMSAIKGLGAGPISAIISAREQGGKFTSIADFATRVDPTVLNKRTLEALGFSGALDDLGERQAISESVTELSAFAKAVREQGSETQASLFANTVAEHPPLEFTLKQVESASRTQRLKWEKDLLGMYISAHPLAGLKKYLGKKVNLVEKLTQKDVGQQRIVGGIVTVLRKIVTKKTGQAMAFFTIEDSTGAIEVSTFPKVYSQFGSQIELGELLIISGRLEKRNDLFQVSAFEIKRADLETMRTRAEKEGFLDDSTGRSPRQVEAPEEDTIKLTKPYQIKLSAETDPAILPQIKSLLTASRDENGTEVEILIPESDKKLKRIKVPFKVGVGVTLEAEIGKLVEA